MITTERTRFILDGKLVENLELGKITWSKYRNSLAVSLSNDGGVTYRYAELTGIEVVDEKDYYRDDESIPWTQFICRSVE
jgi:hypothetical protein